MQLEPQALDLVEEPMIQFDMSRQRGLVRSR